MGKDGSFTIAASGVPAPVLTVTVSPQLPAGIYFTQNNNGTASLYTYGNVPTAGAGTYTFSITATNAVGSASQQLTLTVGAAPTITSASQVSFAAGSSGTFAVTTGGSPTPTLTESGTLPAGVSYNNGVLSANLAANTGGSYPITFTATNSLGTATQHATLLVTVNFISPPSWTFVINGFLQTFTVETTGTPTPALSIASGKPGAAFKDKGNGTATLSTVGTAGTYHFTIAAVNNVATVTQAFTLTVIAKPTPPPPTTKAVLQAAVSAAAPSTLAATPAATALGGGSPPDVPANRSIPGIGSGATAQANTDADDANMAPFAAALVEWARAEEEKQASAILEDKAQFDVNVVLFGSDPTLP